MNETNGKIQFFKTTYWLTLIIIDCNRFHKDLQDISILSHSLPHFQLQ